MRLINTTTLQLETFHNTRDQQPYAILSHRWVGDEEVTFQDMQRPHRQWMPGWTKIRFCCEQAQAEGLQYAWVDTCCIDKESSAELSEAINSMYDWYTDAAVCYAYLNDVQKASANVSTAQMANTVIRSKWFTRAWTLQELIAPAHVIFFDAKFSRLGDKIDFIEAIEEATHIPADTLLNPQNLSRYPVAVRMSWASQRQATRTEDIAYSLFGLFEVNLPLLYGEGSRAFIRLQEEIIRQSNDHSIFLWRSQSSANRWHSTNLRKLSALAPSPKNFEVSQDVIKLEAGDESKPYTMTNVGLQIEMPLFPYLLDTYVALLDCKSRSQNSRYGILLAKDGANTARWYRTCVKDLDIVMISAESVLKHSTLQKLHIMRGRPEESSSENRLRSEPDNENPQPTTFYGMKIDAPSFLDWSPDQVRPYALVAYHDWETKLIDGSTEHTVNLKLSEKRLSNDSLLSPSSYKHISLFHNPTVSTMRIREARLNSWYSASQQKRLGIGPHMFQKPHVDANDTHSGSDEGLSANTVGTFEMPVMTAGTSGIIFFDHLVHGLHAIKVGFDFDFRPVVFLATHEADSDPQLENWIRQWRFKHIIAFEGSPYVQRDIRNTDTRHFWRLHPDMMRSQADLRDFQSQKGDTPVKICEGVYGFRSASSTNADHWTFKPYEDESWHIALSLEKRVVDNLMAWELHLQQRDDVIAVNVEISCDD